MFCKSLDVVRRPRLIDPTKVEEEKDNWLWIDKFARGVLTMISGLPGIGKSFITTFLASTISTGRDWPDGTPCQKGSILLFCSEDRNSDITKRLLNNGADLTLIRIFDGVERIEDGNAEDDSFSFSSLDMIEEAMRNTEQETGYPIAMVVFDPISDYWGSANQNNNQTVRSVLTPLARLSEQTNAVFLLINHDGKNQKTHIHQQSLGATAITAVCRAVWSAFPTNNGTTILSSSKINFCKKPYAIEFRISEEQDGLVEILDTNINMTADQIADELRREQRQNGGQQRKAQHWHIVL